MTHQRAADEGRMNAMSVMHKGEMLHLAVDIARQYEADAFMAEMRADANDAAGNEDQARTERSQATRAAAMAESARGKVEQLQAELEADGFHVVIQPNGAVVCEPKTPDREGVQRGPEDEPGS